MKGYDASTYGDRFADVYDDWYGDVSDVDATVAAIVELAGSGKVLELGVGTGRLALPLAEAGVTIEGIDASQAMVDLMAAKPGAHRVPVVVGDMADLPMSGPYDGAFVAFNTFFNLATEDDQRRCLSRLAQLLLPGGWFAVEAFIPSDEPDAPETGFDARELSADRVRLTITKRDPVHQTIASQHVEITEAGGIKLRPSLLRYLRPEQLDDLAAQ